ncbi:YdcF family protein [Maricaulis sp.]|uniref:YdcF family protein n=1 Tax=Maricaulis sp. TaxID=1486257 RepID=UPI002B26B91B|nr:YdcF family protein [Maricaulis sp.]
MKQSWLWLRGLCFVVVLASAIGFAAYAGKVTGYDVPAAATPVDAIIVLTGDAGRLATGGELYRNGRAPRLMISGVHPSVTTADIRRQTGLDDAAFSCCVTLGREATDTVGNAREAAAYVQANGYDRLIIVTSDYHLPRSLLEFRSRMPGVDLIPYPVRTQAPWQDVGALRLWLQEYAKFTTVQLRHSLTPQTEDA